MCVTFNKFISLWSILVAVSLSSLRRSFQSLSPGLSWADQDGLTSDSRPTKTAQCRRTCLFAIEYLLNDVRIFRQLWNLQDMFTTIFRFDLNSFWVYGVLGGGVGGDKPVKTDSRRIRADALKYMLNDVIIFRQLLNLQDMFTTIFTFDLNSFWVYRVLGGWVGGANTVPTALRLIPTGKFSKSTNMVI